MVHEAFKTMVLAPLVDPAKKAATVGILELGVLSVAHGDTLAVVASSRPVTTKNGRGALTNHSRHGLPSLGGRHVARGRHTSAPYLESHLPSHAPQ
jgi:hypothetical protein